jgi:hypothetical protein
VGFVVMLAHLFYNTPSYGELASMPNTLFSNGLDAAGKDSPTNNIPIFMKSMNRLPRSMVSMIIEKNAETYP